MLKSVCGVDCNKCLFNDRCKGCSICEGSICRHSCKKCGALCPRRGSAIIHLKQTLQKEINLIGNDKYNFTYHIPVLPDRLNFDLDLELVKVVGVHGANFLSLGGNKVRKIYKKNGFRKALNIREDVEGILQFYVKDKTLEGMWDNRKTLYNEFLEQNFKAIIAPNFSVYEDAPRMDHIYNIRRSMIMYNEIMEKGINAIPDVSWYNLSDLDLWIELINKSKIRTIAFSFQVVDVRLKASNAWKNYLAGFRYLCERISEDIDIIIIGASSLKKVLEIRKASVKGAKLYFINQSAYIQSQRGMSSEGRVRDILSSKQELFQKNIRFFNNIYKEINESVGEEHAKG